MTSRPPSSMMFIYWDKLRAKAFEVIPAPGMPESKYMVAVLKDPGKPLDDLVEQDFAWLKGHHKITVSTIQQHCMKHFDFDVELRCDGVVPLPDTTLKTLNRIHLDRFVVFRADPKDVNEAKPSFQMSTSPEPVHRPATDEIGQLPKTSVVVTSHRDFTVNNEVASSAAPPLTPVSASSAKVNPHTMPQPLQDRAPSEPLHANELLSRPHVSSDVRPSDITPSESSAVHNEISVVDTSETSPTAVKFERGPSPRPQVQSCASRHSDNSPSQPSRLVIPTSVQGLPQMPPTTVQTKLEASQPVKAERRSTTPPLGLPEPDTAALDRPQIPKTEPPREGEPQSTPPPVLLEQDTAVFDPEAVFNTEPALEDEPKPTDHSLRKILAQKSPEVLEASVAESMKILDTLSTTFANYKAVSMDANAWIDSIEKLRNQAKRARTVIGVVGSTGSGKSSVINAMLDEERLVPTNCMRACTAVVTELSYNDDNDPNHKYRAEIEFISRSAWEAELKIILKECISENGVLLKEASDENSNAGVAWAKFHAVYPHIPKEDLQDLTVEKLMAPSVLRVLDTIKHINKARPDAFYAELQRYVDSKEKATGKTGQKEQRQASTVEFWPLIKVVKIYTKAAALETGAVIVDLPGVADDNAARAAVADGYMKQCTGVWIVAPITRAVDDQAAKKLLGDSFKMQMKYDGAFSSITFICSKTDDISIEEATRDLQLTDVISVLEDQQHDLEKDMENLDNEISELKESISVYRQVMDEAEKDLETWEGLKDAAEEGEEVFEPKNKSAKRKKRNGKTESRKRRRAEEEEEEDSDVEYISSDSEANSGSDFESDEDISFSKVPLTLESIKQKIEELKLSKKNARIEKSAAASQITKLKSAKAELRTKVADIQAEMSAHCIAGRNEYSRGAIQQDFAAGIRELDEADHDEETFDPEVELRDYASIGAALKVFCVSSRAYQKLCGRLKKDKAVPGFTKVEETEIPQLQAHAKKLTETRRIETSSRFILAFIQQLNSFYLWASDDGTGVKMTDDQKRKQIRYLEMRLQQLREGVGKAVAVCTNEMKNELRNQIIGRFPQLIAEAAKAAPETCQRWGAHRSAGGLYYSTYKAICRRGGSYKSATAGPKDFNAELLYPILKRQATAWESAFQSRLPRALAVFRQDAAKVLRSFHDKIEERGQQMGIGLAALSLLKNSMHNYEAFFQTLAGELLAAMQEAQKDANRDFVPTLASFMETAYSYCTNERGPGCYMRMKDYMTKFVDQERHAMFQAATQTVENHLTQMCQDLESKMAKRSDEILLQMRTDYMRAFGGVQVEQRLVSREEQTLRSEIKRLLLTVDSQFEPIANGEADAENRDADWEHIDKGEADKPLQFDDDDMDSARDLASALGDETMHEVVDDTFVIEPSPKDVNMEAEDGP